jgi:hypothetical protein
VRPLFGIAPGGACHASPVASPAVGSYSTVSPSPWMRQGRTPSTKAVSSLWRFPSGCPGRALPGTLSSWSPDFPRGSPPAVIQPSARGSDRATNGLRQRQSPGHDGRSRMVDCPAPPVALAGHCLLLSATRFLPAVAQNASAGSMHGPPLRRKMVIAWISFWSNRRSRLSGAWPSVTISAGGDGPRNASRTKPKLAWLLHTDPPNPQQSPHPLRPAALSPKA